MNKRVYRWFLSERGQTAVEYIFMLAVVSIIAFSVLGRINEFLYENPDSLLGRFTNTLAGTFNNGQLNLAYKRFVIMQ